MITENYIKMIEQAVELQREWVPKLYDIYRSKKKKEIIVIYSKYGEKLIQQYSQLYLWLPTLEQLWKRLEYYLFNRKYNIYMTTNWYNKRYNFSIFKLEDTDPDEYKEICDIEGKNIKECVMQLLMRIKYHKSWTGEKWEGIKPEIKKTCGNCKHYEECLAESEGTIHLDEEDCGEWEAIK